MLESDEQRALIERIVKVNKNYPGNEDLLEDFCSEAFQKSYMILNSSNDIDKIENYVRKVAHTSILGVLKNSGRIRRVSSGFISTGEVKIEDMNGYVKSVAPVVGHEFIYDFPDPRETAEEIMITKECLQRIIDAVCVIHKEIPAELFYNIFYLRYVKSMKQSAIADELNISQSEVSKRLLRLSKLISNYIDSENRSGNGKV